MFNPVLFHQTRSIRTILPLSKPFLHGNGNVFRQIQSSPSFKKGPQIQLGSVPSNSVKAMADTAVSNGVTAVVTVRPPINPLTAGGQVIDYVEDLFGKSLQLELVSAKDERIDTLFNEGVELPLLREEPFWKNRLTKLVKEAVHLGEAVLRFETYT